MTNFKRFTCVCGGFGVYLSYGDHHKIYCGNCSRQAAAASTKKLIDAWNLTQNNSIKNNVSFDVNAKGFLVELR